MANQVDKIIEPSQALISRGQLMEIAEDPSKLEVVARLMGAKNLDNLYRFMQSPDINPTAKIEFQKMLNKMGKLEGNDDKGGGPQVVINITRAKDHADSLTIEGQKCE